MALEAVRKRLPSQPLCWEGFSLLFHFHARYDSRMKTPWGGMWKLIHLPNFWLKIIRVKGRTSLQSHKNRTEYHFGWYKVNPGEKHRMQHGLFLEIATGKPEEFDIVRYEDDYGRG